MAWLTEHSDLAGFTCADMLRQNGFRGRVILFTREGTLPYDRVSDSIETNHSHCLQISRFNYRNNH